jgi:hypothetical protein
MSSRTLQRRTYTKTGFNDDTLHVDNDSRVDTVWQDQTTELVNYHLTRAIQSITLTAPLAIDDTALTVTAAPQPAVGSILCLKENVSFSQSFILTSVANGANWDLTLDTPLDADFTIDAGCSEESPDLNVNGSITPVEFTMGPLGLANGVEWDITRIIGTITDDVPMDDGRFGGATALTKGIVFRHVDGRTKNLFNIKTNSDIAEKMYELEYSDKAPAGLYGLHFRHTFSGVDKAGVVVRLTSTLNDTFSLIVQDDLTTLNHFHLIAQGHRTDTPAVTE